MTLREARTLLDESAIRLMELQHNISSSFGRNRDIAKRQWIEGLREHKRLKRLVRDIDSMQHAGYIAAKNGIESPKTADRENGDTLLLEALSTFVDLNCELPIVERIRNYFRPSPDQKPDNSDLDYGTPATSPSVDGPLQCWGPGWIRPASSGWEIPLSGPVIATSPAIPLKTPSPVKYLDAHSRAAPGPGSVLYKKQR